MSKTKSKKGDVPQASVLNATKDAGVTKASQNPKAKAKELAKAVAEKHGKKSKQKKVKEPTPEPESESEESSAESESESDAASDSDSGSDEETPVKNGTAKIETSTKAKDDSDSSDSDEASDDESASSDSSDDEAEKVGKNDKVAAAGTKNGIKNGATSDSESSDSSEDDEESDDEKPKAAPKASAKAAESASDSDSDSSDSSDDDEDSADEPSKEEVEPARATAKRKAEEPPASILKKAKTDSYSNGGQGANLFVGSLSWNVDEAWLTQEFEEFGELSGVRVITDRDTGRSKGFAYVEFASADDAAKAHAAKQGAEIDGRRINVDFATSRKNETSKNPQVRAKAYGDQTSDPSDTLWIGNLSFSVDQDGITQAFQEFGTINGVRLPTDRETGAPKGFGYVSFSSIDEAKAAFDAMQGYNLEGRSMRIDFSQPRQLSGDFQSRGGRGGGRGGFGDRGRGGFGGRGGGRGGFGDRGGRGGRGGGRGGRGGSTNRGGFGDFAGSKTTF